MNWQSDFIAVFHEISGHMKSSYTSWFICSPFLELAMSDLLFRFTEVKLSALNMISSEGETLIFQQLCTIVHYTM